MPTVNVHPSRLLAVDSLRRSGYFYTYLYTEIQYVVRFVLIRAPLTNPSILVQTPKINVVPFLDSIAVKLSVDWITVELRIYRMLVRCGVSENKTMEIPQNSTLT